MSKFFACKRFYLLLQNSIETGSVHVYDIQVEVGREGLIWPQAQLNGSIPQKVLVLFNLRTAVERAGLRSLNDGQKINYELVRDKKSGKMSADQLSAA